jgi:hypothetical protein
LQENIAKYEPLLSSPGSLADSTKSVLDIFFVAKYLHIHNMRTSLKNYLDALFDAHLASPLDLKTSKSQLAFVLALQTFA